MAVAGFGPGIRTAHAQFTATAADSLVAQLDSSDWRVRANALFDLGFFPDSLIPSTFSQKVLSLLEQEGLYPEATTDTVGEGYGSYQINLVREALELDDPAALRGLAYLGVQVNQQSKRFLAEHGSTSLPFLEEAWINDTDARQGILVTWALMVGEFRNNISDSERIELLGRILNAADSQPIGFVTAALTAPLPAARPVVQLMEQTSPFQVVRGYATEALPTLHSIVDALPAISLHAALSESAQGICVNASGPRAVACDTFIGLLGQDFTGAELQKFQAFVDSAFAGGTLTEFEHALLNGNAEMLAELVSVPLASWAPNNQYDVGDEVSFAGLDYRCRQAHTSQFGWEPPQVYALWSRINAGDDQGIAYRAIQGHQSQPGWEPPNVPALWAPVD
jgi:hypothetical protein